MHETSRETICRILDMLGIIEEFTQRDDFHLFTPWRDISLRIATSVKKGFSLHPSKEDILAILNRNQDLTSHQKIAAQKSLDEFIKKIGMGVDALDKSFSDWALAPTFPMVLKIVSEKRREKKAPKIEIGTLSIGPFRLIPQKAGVKNSFDTFLEKTLAPVMDGFASLAPGPSGRRLNPEPADGRDAVIENHVNITFPDTRWHQEPKHSNGTRNLLGDTVTVKSGDIPWVRGLAMVWCETLVGTLKAGAATVEIHSRFTTVFKPENPRDGKTEREAAET